VTSDIEARLEAVDDPDFEAFRRRAYQLTGLDLTAYKAPQMHRRLSVLLGKVGAGSFSDYALVLERDAERRKEFRDYVTINVSEFFRDGERFAELERHILPDLLVGERGLSIWSAGCSIGAEPYSMAVLLQELAPTRRHTILATDVAETILERARRGDGYLAADLRNVGERRLARWFTQSADGRFAIHSAARAVVTFRRHDLLRDRYPSGPFDVVACRNVVIYFTERAKERIYEGFVDTLRTGGVLFVGGTEAIMRPSVLGLEPLAPGFYRKLAPQ
jgi:chemotaxis protein methyltransferase CheR